jgi:hypothetical protein
MLIKFAMTIINSPMTIANNMQKRLMQIQEGELMQMQEGNLF